MTIENVGIFQTDLIVRSGVILALKELQSNPNLVRDCLASLTQDSTTVNKYGDKTIEQCIDWFCKTRIPVKLNLQLSQFQSPCVVVQLADESEEAVTIGDINYVPSELDPYSTLGESRSLGSLHARTSVTVSCIVDGEPEHVLLLTSLVLFGIFRHKRDLFENRGFTRMTWQMGKTEEVTVLDRENVFARTIQLNGFIRHSWPIYNAGNKGPVESIEAFIKVAPPDYDPITPTEPTLGGNLFDLDDWEERDGISGHKS